MVLPEQDQSLLTTFALVLAVAIACQLLFSFFRERVPRFYAARQSWQGVPFKCNPGFFGWVRSVMTVSDDQLYEHYGLDVVMYQRWLWSIFISIVCIFFISMVILMPLDVIGDNKYLPINSTKATRGFAVLSMSNIDTSHQVRLFWAHFFAVFIFSAIPLIVLVRDWRFYSKAAARTRALELPSNYNIMVYGLPGRIRSLGDPQQADRELADAYRAYFGEHVEHAHVAVYDQQLSQLVAEYHEIERDLEVAYHVWRKTNKRPKTFAGTGLMRMWPPWKTREDAIEWLSKRRQVVFDLVEKAQARRNHAIVSLGFVKFDSQVNATMAAQLVLAKNRFRFNTVPAPDPRDVVWEHIHIGHVQCAFRKVICYTIFAAMIIFWMIPVLFAASLTNLTRLSNLGAFHWLRTILNWQPALARVIEGILPVLIVNMSFLIAPPIIRFVCTFIGLWRHSEEERKARNVLLFLLVFNVLLVYTISGTIFFNLNFFLKETFSGVVDLLAQTIPQQAYYFTSYVITNGMLGSALLLLRPHFCGLWLFLRHVWAKSPAQRHEADRPFYFDFDENYARASLVSIIVITYSTMFPLILVFGMIYFFLMYLVFRYNSLYVYVPRYEGFGRQFPFAFTAVVIGLTIYQLTMFGVLQLAGFWAAPGLFAATIVTWLVWSRIRLRFNKPVIVGALNTLKGQGLLARAKSDVLDLKLLQKGLEVDMNRSESDISLNAKTGGSRIGSRIAHGSRIGERVHTSAALSVGYSLKPTHFAVATEALDLGKRVEKSVRKSPYLQPERRKLKPPYDFALRSRTSAALLLTKQSVEQREQKHQALQAQHAAAQAAQQADSSDDVLSDDDDDDDDDLAAAAQRHEGDVEVGTEQAAERKEKGKLDAVPRDASLLPASEPGSRF